MARRLNRPVIAFAGRVEETVRAALRGDCFDALVALSDVEPGLTEAERMAREPELLRVHAARLAARVAAVGFRPPVKAWIPGRLPPVLPPRLPAMAGATRQWVFVSTKALQEISTFIWSLLDLLGVTVYLRCLR